MRTFCFYKSLKNEGTADFCRCERLRDALAIGADQRALRESRSPWFRTDLRISRIDAPRHPESHRPDDSLLSLSFSISLHAANDIVSRCLIVPELHHNHANTQRYSDDGHRCALFERLARLREIHRAVDVERGDRSHSAKVCCTAENQEGGA